MASNHLDPAVKVDSPLMPAAMASVSALRFAPIRA